MTCYVISYEKIALIFIYALFEYWIGKTEKFKAASLLELILTGLIFIWISLKTKGNEDGR